MVPEKKRPPMKLENKLITTYIGVTLLGAILFLWAFGKINDRFDRFDKRMDMSKEHFHTRFQEKFNEMSNQFDQMAERHRAFTEKMETDLKAKRESMKQEFEEESAKFLKEHKAFVDDFDRRFLHGRTLKQSSQNKNPDEQRKDP